MMASDFPESFGSLIRRARLNAGLTQFELARLVGVREITIHMWETEQSRMVYGQQRLPLLSEILNVSIDLLHDTLRVSLARSVRRHNIEYDYYSPTLLDQWANDYDTVCKQYRFRSLLVTKWGITNAGVGGRLKKLQQLGLIDRSRPSTKRAEDTPHGTWRGYINWKCRCEACIVAGRQYGRERKRKSRSKVRSKG